MSRNQNPFAYGKPITLDTLGDLFAHHRHLTGGYDMSLPGSPAPEPPPPAPDAPQRPDGVSEDEWNALGDPGKLAIVRERNRAETAERNLAAARARPTPPPTPAPTAVPQPTPTPAPAAPRPGDPQDLNAIIQQAVQAAIKPFTDREEQRTIDEAATAVRTSVLDAAKLVLHDPSDALANIDLTTVIDDAGVADPAKVKTALETLVASKPHLARPATFRQAPPGIGGGAPVGATDGEKVAAALQRMQKSVNLRPPTTQPTR